MTKRFRRSLVGLLALATAILAIGAAGASALPRLDPLLFGQTLFSAVPEPTTLSTDPPGFFSVKADEFDPGKTNLVQGTWLPGIGCPTGARIAIPDPTFTEVAGYEAYTDTACSVGDPKDQHNEGLLLAKTGPTGNFASAIAELNRV